jgi:hypothetical protein
MGINYTDGQPVDPWHGTPNGYKRHGCRCPACRKAKVDYERNRRHAKRIAAIPIPEEPA